MKTRRWVVMAVLGIVALSGLAGPASAGGGGGGGGGPCTGFSSGSEVVLRDSCFDGVAHFAAKATGLVVRNEGVIPHSFTAVDGSFDSGLLQPGEEVTIALGQERIVKVVCTLHGTSQGHGMAGVLLIGSPEVTWEGGADEVARIVAEHESRLGGQLQAGAEGLDRVEESLRRLEAGNRSGIVATAAVGALVLLVAAFVFRRERLDRAGTGRTVGGSPVPAEKPVD